MRVDPHEGRFRFGILSYAMVSPPVLFTVFYLLTMTASFSFGQAQESPATVPAWEHVHRWKRGECERMSEDLQTAHASLLVRARAEDPSLVSRLQPEPPRPRPRGYGVLPKIVPDEPRKSKNPKEWRYSLETLSTGFQRDFRDAAILAGRAGAEPALPLEEAVKEYERLLASLRNIEEHLSYHEWWQGAIADDPKYFNSRNRIIKKLTELQQLKANAGDQVRMAELERDISDAVAPFRKSDSLQIERRDGGALVLPVTVHTDIEDEAFLKEFRGGVEEIWNNSDAMGARRLSLDLEIVSHSPDELYPEGPPPRETKIEIADHVGRFPEGVMLLTTGAESTHAWQARSVLLGPMPLTRRALAHEFGHLLGFSDAYLRGYEGEFGGSFGVVVVEWRNLRDDLMGLSGSGTVSSEMVDHLLRAYGDG